MHEGDALLGIFLATYSSKGDYLPLRYPLTQADYEYMVKLLKRTDSTETLGDQHHYQKQDRKGGGQIAADATKTPAQQQSVPQSYQPSRNGSYASLGNVATQSVATTSNSNTGHLGGGSSTGIPNRANNPQSGRKPDPAAQDETRLFTDGALQPTMTMMGPDRDIRNLDKPHHQPTDSSLPMDCFDAKFLAQLFSPRPSMSDQRFQVAVDNVLFIGHPLRDDPKDTAEDSDYYDTEQDEVETMSRIASLAERDGWKITSNVKSNPNLNKQSTKLLADLGLVNLVLNREPSEAGDSTISDGERAIRDSQEWKNRGYKRRVYPKMFHVVFMLDNTVPNVGSLADRIYEHVLKKLTQTLMIEQVESNFVLTQSRIIRNINDIALAEGYTTGRYLKEVVERSSLAANLVELYNGLRQGKVVHLHVRKRMKLSLHIPRGPPLDRPQPPVRHRTFFHNIPRGTTHPVDTSAAASTSHTPRPNTPKIAYQSDDEQVYDFDFAKDEDDDNDEGDDDAVANGQDKPRESQKKSYQRYMNELSLATQTVAPEIQEYWGPIIFDKNAAPLSNTYYNHASLKKLLRSSSKGGLAPAPPGIVLTDRELQPGECSRYPRIQPYHALLLMEDMNDLRRKLIYSDSAPTLVAVVERASPSKTLAQLHMAIDCSFAQLCRLVAHLVYWNVVKLICPLSLEHTYIPTINRMTPEIVEMYNQQEFSLCTLPHLLAKMHPPRPALQVLESLAEYANKDKTVSKSTLRAEFREILLFLLREDIISQYHTWPVILVPNYVKFNLGEAQFVRLSIAWFRSLHAAHPDLLSGFPLTLINESELDCWKSDEERSQVDVELFTQAFRDAESQVMLCRVMRKLALRKVQETYKRKMRGKHGKELEKIKQMRAIEEDKIHSFCNQAEKKHIDEWIEAKDEHSKKQEQTRIDRAEARKEAAGADTKDGENRIYRWYNFIREDPDLDQLSQEIIDRYVAYVPTEEIPQQRTEAERRYLYKLIEGKPDNVRDQFSKCAHMYTGSNHLVKLRESEQSSPWFRPEELLRELKGIVHLPQHT